MVKGIDRSRYDLLGLPLFGFLFGNQKFLLALRILVVALFVYAVIFGFLFPDKKENFFTTGLFWGLFWPFFMLVTLPTFGAIFCSVCPHGFLGSYISKVGFNKKVPEALQNRYIGLGLLLVLYWCAFYIYEPLYKSPLSVAIFFLVFTVLAVVFFFLFENMAYCKYICPIGSIKNAFGRVSFIWLGTNKEHCSSCKEFICAKDCHYGLSPFNFEKNNSMQDCTLCMACAKSCDAVSLEVRKPSFSLYGAIKKSETIDIWVYILLFAVISLTMRFHHALGRSAIADSLPWYAQATAISQAFPSIEIPLGGVLALIYAVIFTLIFSLGGFYVSSKILKISYKESFINFGYALAPLMIIGSLSHVGSFFFTSYYHSVVNGFIQAFALPFEYAKPLAKHGESWLGIFKIFTYLAILWSLFLMTKRFRLIEADIKSKILAFPFASGMIVLAIASEIAVGLIFSMYGVGGHRH